LATLDLFADLQHSHLEVYFIYGMILTIFTLHYNTGIIIMDISKSFLKQVLTSIVFIATFGFGQTDVSGTISSNTTWDVSGSPYTITANTVIMDGVTLTIEAGVTVLFSQDVYLRALSGATLIAQGTEADSIYFTVTNTSTVTNTEGIEFASGAVGSTVQNDTTYVSGSVFDYCVFQHFITTGGGGAISIQNVSLLIKNSLFENNIASDGGALSIASVSTHYFVYCNFINNSVSGNGGAIKVTGSGGWSSNGTYKYINSKFVNNSSSSGGAICGDTGGHYSNSGEHFVYDCMFINNTSGTGSIFYSQSIGGGIFYAENSQFINNYSSGDGGIIRKKWGHGMEFDNCIFKNNGTGGKGGITYSDYGSCCSSPSVSFESCSFINNYSSSGGTISLGEVNTSITLSNSFLYNNYTQNSSDGGLINTGGSITFQSNYVLSNRSSPENISLMFGSFQGENSCFIDNEAYIVKFQSGGTETVNIENNYWGTKSSLVIDSLIYDFNDDPNFNTPVADYTPFLLAPFDSLVGSPSSITGVSLKTDSTYQISLTDNIDPGDTLHIELAGADTDSLSKGLAVAWVINTMTQDTVIKTLIESSETSGLFRGAVYTAVSTDNINDIIQGQDGQVLKVISRMNPNQQATVIIGDTPLPILSNFTVTDETDLMHTLNHTPAFIWSYYDPLSTAQGSYQIQISSDANYSTIDMWDSGVISSTDTSVVYSGNALTDGTTYYARLQVVTANSIPSNYEELTFRMNTEPTTPVLVSPINDQVTATPVVLNVLNGSDAESDAVMYSFNLYNDATLTTKLDSATAVTEGTDTTSWQVTATLPDNGQYFWTVSTNDGYEESAVSDAGSFLLNTDNNPPDMFTLSMPLVNTAVQNLSPVFSWHPANDPDPIDTVHYTLMLDTPDPGVVVFEVGTDTSFQVPDPLMDNTQYFWQVIAEDLLGFQTINEGGYQTFYINLSNDPPSVVTLITPTDNSIEIDLTPIFYWTESLDPDPMDHVSYTLSWWGTGDMGIQSVDTDSNSVTPETILMDNSMWEWMVTANDMHGAQSNSDSSYFYTDALPEPPLNFATVTPENNAEGIATEVEFAWNETHDPDPVEEIHYQLVYATDWADSSTYVFSELIQDTSLTVTLANNSQYYWIVVATDTDGFMVGSNENMPNTMVVGTLSIDGADIPEVFALHQNYPNPFNPTTQIKYDLPEDAMVSITIYDLMGRSIKSLVNSNQSAGYRSIQWNATNNLGEPVSAGMYIYMIQAGEFRQTKKMVLLK
jgi:hypothetical protein